MLKEISQIFRTHIHVPLMHYICTMYSTVFLCAWYCVEFVLQVQCCIHCMYVCICCSAQTEHCTGECCPVWVLQQIYWISLGK